MIYLRTETDRYGDAVDYQWFCCRSCYLASLAEIPAAEPGRDDRVRDGLEEGGAYPCGAESDSPDFCAQCETPVGNPLTDEGAAYTGELVAGGGRHADALREAYPSLVEEDDVWALLDAAPQGCEPVADLYHWSLNFDCGRGPFALFLDLIGWSEEEIGQPLYTLDGAQLGYLELGKLAAALTGYADHPHEVRDYTAALMQAEGVA